MGDVDDEIMEYIVNADSTKTDTCVDEYLSIIRIRNERAEEKISRTFDAIESLMKVDLNTEDLLKMKLTEEFGDDGDVMQLWSNVCKDMDEKESGVCNDINDDHKPISIENCV